MKKLTFKKDEEKQSTPIASVEALFKALDDYIDVHFDDFPSEMLFRLLAKSDVEVILKDIEARDDSEVEDIMNACCERLGPDGADNVQGLVDIIGIEEVLIQLDEYLSKRITSAEFAYLKERFGK